MSEVEKAKHPGKTRTFNIDYLALMDHFGMTPRTTDVGAKEQNGDVEAANGATKRRLEQALLIRGNRDFLSVEEWQRFVDNVQRKGNKQRGKRVAEELAAMRRIPTSKLPEFIELHLPVSEWSTIRVKGNAYSLPSRLIGKEVLVRLFEDRLEVYFGNTLQLACARIVGRNNRIDYRHIIWSLVRKPGGFARYVYRDDMFPSPVFRQTYDSIVDSQEHSVSNDLEYLRILHLAASTSESDVEASLSTLLSEGLPITADCVKALVGTPEPTAIPDLEPPEVDLASYDDLIHGVAS